MDAEAAYSDVVYTRLPFRRIYDKTVVPADVFIGVMLMARLNPLVLVCTVT